MTLLKMSFYGAVIILVILILRAFTLHKLPKRAFLILWAVALVRLLVPFEISSGLSLYSLLPEAPEELPLFTEQKPYIPDPANPYDPFENYADYLKNQGNTQIIDEDVILAEPDGGTIYLPIDNADVDAIPLPDTETDANYTEGTSGQEPSDAVAPSAPTGNNPTGLQVLWNRIVPLLPVLWAVGASLCAVFFLICYLKCLREFRTALPVTEDYATEWLNRHPLKRKISIRQSDKISAPLTYGLLRPVILLPKKTDWSNTSQLDYVLYHEFTHIRRFDLPAKLVMIAALCLHWFNPFVWVMYVFFNRDLELSCDDCVVKHFNQTKSDYAKTLIGMEERKNYGTPLCNHFSKNAIEERITAIMKSKKTTTSMIVAAIIIILIVIITLTTGRKEEKVATDITSTPTETVTPSVTPAPTGTDTASKPTPAPGQEFYYPERNYTYRQDDFAEFEYNSNTISPKDGYDFTISSLVSTAGKNLLTNVTINLEEYAGNTAWWCLAAFYDGEDNNVYLEFVPAAGVEDAPSGILHVTIPVTNPDAYSVHPAGDFHAQKASAFWFGEICKIQDNIYFNTRTCDGSLWVYDISTGEMSDLTYVNEKMLELAKELCADFGWEHAPAIWHNVGWHSYDGIITYEANVCKEMDLGTFFIMRVYYMDGQFLDYSYAYKGAQEEPYTQEELTTQIQELFFRYQEMQEEFFYTNLKVASHISSEDWVTINGTGGYTKVLDERFPTLRSVFEYMETICTPQFAMYLRDQHWKLSTTEPTVTEHNGMLYTRCYDAVILKESYRFSPIIINEPNACTLSYEAYIGIPSNKTESGTVSFEYTDGSWHVSNHSYTYYHDYIDDLDLDLFSELYEDYRTLQHELFYGSLDCTAHSYTESEEVTINGVDHYYKVTDERFPTLKSVIDYMETVCTPGYAKELRKEYLDMESAYPHLAELNGELYTLAFGAGTSDDPASFRFTDITILDSNRVRVGYQGYNNSLINVRVSGTIDYVNDSGWRIDSITTNWGNPYFDTYNGEKLQILKCRETGSVSPNYCNDIIFYRADEDETIEDILIAMKTVILESLTVPSDERPFTVTDYDVTAEQPYQQIDMFAWRVPFLAQGSDEIFNFILLEGADGVYRLQREEAATGMLSGTFTYSPDYVSSHRTFPRLTEKDVTVTGKNWCLTHIDELTLPRYQELANAGAKAASEKSTYLNIGHWYTLSLDGISYFFYREDAPTSNDEAFAIAITSPDYPLSGGARVGMTVEELLTLYPDLAKSLLVNEDPVFEAQYGPSMYGFRADQFPPAFLAEYEYAYLALTEKEYPGLPICIVFLVKDGVISAITEYMPTAN